MTETYKILYDKPRYGDYIKGLALPIFIHNGSYFLTTLDLYADGLVECWGVVPIASLHKKVESGWITTAPPIGGQISIHDLGSGTLSEVKWERSEADIIPAVEALFQQLNPDGQNLFDLDERRRKLAAELNIPERQVGHSRMRSNYGIYRLGENGEEIAGASLPVFWSSPDGLILTECFIYADGKLSIGYGTQLHSVEEMRALFDTERIRISVGNNEWINIPGLGRFKVRKGHWYIEKEELWKDILNGLNVLNGHPDIVERCFQAFLAYQEDATDENRERLRTAYEAVPKHHRLYTQRDQDAKDHTIRRILYGNKAPS